MLRLSRSIAVLSLCASLGLGACGQQNQGGGGGPARGAPDVSVVTIQPQRAVLTAELPGRTLPYAVSDVRPQVSGILRQRLFVEGSQVEAGQPLYQIDDTLYQAALESAAAQLANARAALTTARLRAERYRSLRAEKSISQQDYDDAEAALQQAEANVAQREADLATAKINLDYTRITAPISGRIGRSYLTQGALVTANQAQALATIQTLDPIYVDMSQSSSELLALRRALGDGISPDAGSAPVRLTLDDGAPYPLEGSLRFQEVVVDQTTGTVTLRAEFPNPDGVLLPGMFVRATIVERVEPQALLVPQRGVGRDNRGNATALIVDADGTVQSRVLSVVQTVGASWLVDAGIEAGDRVIVEGLQFVRPGQKANAQPFRDPAEARPADGAASRPPASPAAS
ncbi:MAG: efflux RND transporter periplasmic adaptor subunit [Pseudomonadales bacterium]